MGALSPRANGVRGRRMGRSSPYLPGPCDPRLRPRGSARARNAGARVLNARGARWYATSVNNAMARARELADRSQGIPSPLAVDIAVNFGKSKRGAAPVPR